MKRLWLGLGAFALVAAAAVAGEAGTVISGAGNGVGNAVKVSGTSGTTVIRGSRWGVGNTIAVENNGSRLVIDDAGVTVDGKPVSGAAKRFWSKRVWSEKCGAYLYWSPKAKRWYRFDTDDRAYYPVEVYPEDE